MSGSNTGARRTITGLVAMDARCEGCSWTCEAKNAQGLAAQHHDRTGHVTVTIITRLVQYGEKPKPPAGGK